MDPNPSNFPILSYVMSKLPSFKAAAGVGDDYDVERPSPTSPASLSSRAPNFELTERMPHLKDPKLISEMRLAVANVAQTRAMLKNLGERPDHESVDSARSNLAEVEANLSGQLDEIVLSPKEGEDEVADPGRKALEKEKHMYKALISLDAMHEAYGKMLAEAEDRLNRIYEAAVEGRNVGDPSETVENESVVLEDEVNEEVVVILKQVERNETVERVDLSGRQLRLLPEAFGRIKTLVVLDLSNNQLEAIPDSIAGLENLEELNLSSNLLQDLPDSIGLLFKLKNLDASRNKLTSLPDSICQCRSLVELNASFNKLTYLPTNIGHELENLKSLIVAWNKIRHLPTSIGEMKSLQLLDVHFNELHGIPPSIGRLTTLEILNLSNNFSDLCELPSTIGDLTNLKELNLSNNQIHELPDTIGLLENLTNLNIDENPLVIPPKEIVQGGVEAIKAYMVKIQLDRLEEEEQRSLVEASGQGRPSVLTRSTTWLNNVVSNVSDTVLGYLDGVDTPRKKDPYLDQQF